MLLLWALRHGEILALRPEPCRLLAEHRLGSCGPHHACSDLRHHALHMPDQLGQLDQAVAVGVAVAQRVEQRPGEDAVALT